MNSINDLVKFRNLEQRLAILEEKVFKKSKRIAATKAQKILILKHTGLLEKIEELNLSQNQKALFVSILIDADTDNVEKDLSQIHIKNSRLESELNYNFLEGLFKKLKLQKQAKEVEKILLKISQSKKS